MSSVISAYPMLNGQLLSRIRVALLKDYSFFYSRGDDEYELMPEELGAGSINHKLVDQTGSWDPDSDNLIVRRSLFFQNYGCLFGPGGIACRNSTIGIAVVWTSADSKQRGAIPIGELQNDDASKTINLEQCFTDAILRGMVEFSTVLYIKRAGTPDSDEGYLANTYGMLLGEIDKYQIQLDGSGSVFPIYEVNEPDQPLWYVRCDWTDPTYDLFSQTVAIYLNKAHKNFKYIDRGSTRTFDPQLLKEIIASALSTIIIKLKGEEGYWQSTIQGVNIQQGSVSEAVNYFVNTLEWDVSSPEVMAISIRKFLDEKDM